MSEIYGIFHRRDLHCAEPPEHQRMPSYSVWASLALGERAYCFSHLMAGNGEDDNKDSEITGGPSRAKREGEVSVEIRHVSAW